MDNDERDDKLENPLGIAREPVPHDEHLSASNDEASRKRRRQRALGGVEERRTIPGEADDPEGATGIDMGAGGDGHGIKTSRD